MEQVRQSDALWADEAEKETLTAACEQKGHRCWAESSWTVSWSDSRWSGLHYQPAMRNREKDRCLNLLLVALHGNCCKNGLQIYKSSTSHRVSPITSHSSSPKRPGCRKNNALSDGLTWCMIFWYVFFFFFPFTIILTSVPFIDPSVVAACSLFQRNGSLTPYICLRDQCASLQIVSGCGYYPNQASHRWGEGRNKKKRTRMRLNGQNNLLAE